MLRTFDLAVKGAANKSAQGIALGGVGIAVRVTRRPRGAGHGSSEPGVTRRTRGARRGSPDPAGLPDRQVSRAHRRPRFQRCSCLLSLLQNKETYRSGIWAGSGDHCGEHLRQVQHPGKTAFSAELSRFFMARPGKCFPKELILLPSEFEKSLVFKRDFDFLKMFTAVVRRPAPSAGLGDPRRAPRGRRVTPTAMPTPPRAIPS